MTDPGHDVIIGASLYVIENNDAFILCRKVKHAFFLTGKPRDLSVLEDTICRVLAESREQGCQMVLLDEIGGSGYHFFGRYADRTVIRKR